MIGDLGTFRGLRRARRRLADIAQAQLRISRIRIQVQAIQMSCQAELVVTPLDWFSQVRAGIE